MIHGQIRENGGHLFGAQARQGSGSHEREQADAERLPAQDSHRDCGHGGNSLRSSAVEKMLAAPPAQHGAFQDYASIRWYLAQPSMARATRAFNGGSFMKRMINLGVLMFLGLATPLFALPQQHPSIAPGAHETDAKALHSLLDHNGKVLVIDVRTPQEYAKEHIPEAVNVPIDELPQKIRQMQVSKDTPIVTMCDHGGRSSHAALELQKMGYEVTSFCRIDSWRKDGYKVAKGNSKSQAK
jgi:rhodanese-related sulfurtransferase